MDRAYIQDLLDKEPFEPFTVIMFSGEQYDVKNPALAMLLATTLFIALDRDQKETPDSGDLATRFKMLSLPHITAVQSLQAA